MQPDQSYAYPTGYYPAPGYPYDPATMAAYPGWDYTQAYTGLTEQAPVTGPEKEKKEKSPKLEIQGNPETMNLPGPLLVAIQSNEYFKGLYELKTYNQVVQEIARDVDHLGMYCVPNSSHFLDSWDPNQQPSLNVKWKGSWPTKARTYKHNHFGQVNFSSYVRGAGLLFLRLCGKFTDLLSWFEPLFSDSEEIILTRGGTKPVTVGQFAKKLLVDQKHFTLLLPRIPPASQKTINAGLEGVEVPLPAGQSRDDSDRGARSGRDDSDRSGRGGRDDSDRSGRGGRDDRRGYDSRKDDNRDGKEKDRGADEDRSRDRRKDDKRNDERRYDDRRHDDKRHDDRKYRDDRDKHSDRRRDDRDHHSDRRRDDDRRRGSRDDYDRRRDRDRDHDRRRDSRSERKRSPSRSPPPVAPKKPKVDLAKLREQYGDASGETKDSQPQYNSSLGTTEVVRIGF